MSAADNITSSDDLPHRAVICTKTEDMNMYFKNGTLPRDCLYAENNCGEVWQLDIRSPECVGLTIVISGDHTEESAQTLTE